MDKQEETRTWLKFFKDAGIPKKTGASYAHIFVENRIHKDMLSELTVDYLRLMGITLMGDIIAIMRHCKSVHQESLRKVVILQSKDVLHKISSSSSSSSEDSSDDDVEVIEVTKTSTKRIPAPTTTTDSKVKKESVPSTDTKQIKNHVVGKIVSSKPTPATVSEKRTPAQPVKRKYSDDSENITQEEELTSRANNSSKSAKSILKAPTSTPKKIKVTTENDIIGPKLPPPKKTVFERLGAETSSPQVSSTTEVPLVKTKFTRTISNVNLPLTSVSLTSGEDSPLHKACSVFNRLGGLKDSTQEAKVAGPALPYAGVLKASPIMNRPSRPTSSIKHMRCTMRADEPEVPVKLRASTSSSAMKKTTFLGGETSLKNRLKSSQVTIVALQKRKLLNVGSEGILGGETSLKNRLKSSQVTKVALKRRKPLNVGSQGIFANHSKPDGISVKHRLGLVSSSGEESSTFNIKQRISRPHSPVVKKYSSMTSYDEKDVDGGFVFGSRVERSGIKKVSFGKIEQKVITPDSSLRSSGVSRSVGGGRSGIHSRLGTRYS